jgi:hypothetical protein
LKKDTLEGKSSLLLGRSIRQAFGIVEHSSAKRKAAS